MIRGQSDFARVYEEHVWAVYAFLAYRASDRDTAEELTQETFERALRAWPRFDPRRGSERGWLLTIAQRLLIDHHRRSRHSRPGAVDERLLGAVRGPEERFASSPDLVDALAQLGEREREILALRYGGDLAGPEIAALLGLSLANVQQITSRALRKLRELLGESELYQSASSAPSPISNKPRAR